MKRKLLLIFFSLIFLFSISSCSSKRKSSNEQIIDNPTSKYIKYDTDDYSVPMPTNPSDKKVIYDCNNGFKYTSFLTSDNKVLKPTNDPTKIASTFVGWYSDEELTKEFNFNESYSKDLTIYAKYDTNIEEISNLIYESTILSNIRITSTFANDDKYQGTKTEVIGSGVIFSASNTGYYALTNHHVIYNENNYIFSKYDVYDCYNNHYQGTVSYKDVDYDLAIIYFSRNNIDGVTVKEKLNDISFSNFIPKENEKIVSIGNPHKIMNSISYGKYLGLKSYTASQEYKDKSNINFDVLSHSSKIETGSSGGMVLDTNLRLIGINFASKVNDGEFEYAYAVPLSKVIEFILNFEEKD